MHLFHHATSDWRHFRIWLRRQVVLAVGFVLIVTSIQMTCESVGDRKAAVEPADVPSVAPMDLNSEMQFDLQFVHAGGFEIPESEARADFSDRGSVAHGLDTHGLGTQYAHQPTGWRRTPSGWQNTTEWFDQSLPLPVLIAEQEASEPSAIQTPLAMIRAVPPIVYAIIQIGLIALVVRLYRKKR